MSNGAAEKLLMGLLMGQNSAEESERSPPGLPEARIMTMKEVLANCRVWSRGDVVMPRPNIGFRERYVGEPFVVLKCSDLYTKDGVIVLTVAPDGEIVQTTAASWQLQEYVPKDA